MFVNRHQELAFLSSVLDRDLGESDALNRPATPTPA